MTDDPELSAIRGTAFVDGRYVPLAEASVPILDRGFVRSDATYDVAHVWKGRFFRLDDHVARFQADVGVSPLPFGRLERTITLCARAGALQGLPAALAARLRAQLDAQVVSPAVARWPWMRESFRLL